MSWTEPEHDDPAARDRLLPAGVALCHNGRRHHRRRKPWGPFAILVNGGNITLPHAGDAETATATAEALIAKGYSLDLGLIQVNTANLPALHLSVRDMFIPGLNIAAGSFIFRHDYDAALADMKTGPEAVDAALSAYNSGNFLGGIQNGYVAHYDVTAGIDGIVAHEGSGNGGQAPVATSPSAEALKLRH